MTGILPFLLRLASYQPNWFIRAFSKLLVWLFPILQKRDSQILSTNIKQVFGLPHKTTFHRMFYHQVLRHHFLTLLEFPKVLRCSTPEQVPGFARLAKHLGAYQESGRATILITGHLGNWELFGHLCQAATDAPFYALGKPLKKNSWQRQIAKMRRTLGIHMLWTDQKNLLRKMLEILAEPGCLCFLMDQNPHKRIGTQTQFMGQTTSFVSGPAKMAAKTNCAVVAAFCVRDGSERYRLISREILPPGHGIKDHEQLTKIFAKELEKTIRQYPEQWCWNYKRWRFATERQA